MERLCRFQGFSCSFPMPAFATAAGRRETREKTTLHASDRTCQCAEERKNS
jgi:hypothetical protein